jgi:hypothetical protein
MLRGVNYYIWFLLKENISTSVGFTFVLLKDVLDCNPWNCKTIHYFGHELEGLNKSVVCVVPNFEKDLVFQIHLVLKSEI